MWKSLRTRARLGEQNTFIVTGLATPSTTSVQQGGLMSRKIFWLLTAVFCSSTAQDVYADRPKLLRPQDVVIPVEALLLQRQYEALSKMPSVEVAYTDLGLLYRLKGPTGIVFTSGFRGLQLGEAAPEALAKLGPILLASGSETFTVRRNDISGGMGYRRIILQQSIRGIPVVSGLLDLDVDDANGMLHELHSRFVPDRGLPSKPKLTADEAAQRAVEYLEGAQWAEPESVQIQGEPTLAYFAGTHEPQKPSLIWVVRVNYFKPVEGSEDRHLWIDAIDGTLRGVGGDVWSALSATVYTAHGAQVSTGGFPSGLTQIPPTQDSISQNAHQNVTKSHDAWSGTFNEQIGPVGIVVHWGSSNPGAAYTLRNGTNWLAFSDGNSTFTPAGNSLDMAAHEYGHGVFYKYVPGASLLNEESGNISEAYGDYSAVMADVYHRGDLVTDASWQLYEHYRLEPTRSDVSWSNPRAASPYHQDWYPTRTIGLFAAPHYNATIMGHAFYLISQGGRHARAGTSGHTGCRCALDRLSQDDADLQFGHEKSA